MPSLANSDHDHRHNLRRVPPLFGLRGIVPHFSGRKGKEFESHAVNRGDLRRLNYNKTVFGRPHWESSRRSPRPQNRRRRGYFLPILLLSCLEDASFSVKLVAPIFRPKLRPGHDYNQTFTISLHKIKVRRQITICQLANWQSKQNKTRRDSHKSDKTWTNAEWTGSIAKCQNTVEREVKSFPRLKVS